MLRDNRVSSSHQCLENPRPAGAELSLTEDVTSPFQAEPTQESSLPVGSSAVLERLKVYFTFAAAVYFAENETVP
jgi:hypothetical protein